MAIPMEQGLSEATPSTARFSVGDLVEVKQTEVGLRGSWHPGVVVKVGPRTRVIRFDELFTDDFSKQLEETVPVSAIADGGPVEAREGPGEAAPMVDSGPPAGSQNGHASGGEASGAGEARSGDCCAGLLIRPRPPKASKPYVSQWRVGTPVEMFQNDAWWEGLLLQDMKDKKTLHGKPVVEVHFPDEDTSEVVPTENLRHGLMWCEHTNSWTMRSSMCSAAAAQVESARKRRRVNLAAADEEPLKLSPLIFNPQAKPPDAPSIRLDRGSNGTLLSPTRDKSKSIRVVVKPPSKLPKKLTKVLAGEDKNGCTPSRETEARKMSKAVFVGQQFADMQRSMLAGVGSLGEDVLELEAEVEDEKVTVKRRGRPRGDSGAGASGGSAPGGSGGKGKPRLVQGKKMVKGAPGRQQLRVKSDPVENTPLAKVQALRSSWEAEGDAKVEAAELMSQDFVDLIGGSTPSTAGGKAVQRPAQYAREIAILVEAGMLKDGQKVAYRDAKTKEDLVTAVVSGGCCFVCLCCNTSHNLSSLEAHTGKTYRRPAKNTWVEDGRSIADLKNELLSMRLAKGELEPLALAKTAQKSSSAAPDSLAVDFSALPPVPGDYSDELCRMCGEGGELLCCDSCPATLHLHCMGLEAVPEGDWYCPMCRCSLCGLSHFQAEGFGDNTIIFCDQCTRQYHVSCLREHGRADLKRLPKGEWFCSSACRKVFKGLRGLVGQTIPLQEDFYVSILREGWDPTASAVGTPGASLGSPPPPKAPASGLDPASKRQLSMALEVMQECFHPIKDAYTQVDLIPFIVRSGKTPTRDCSNFYTFLLGKGKDAITVASVRVYGAEVAEMPLIGTRFTFRRQGMCRRLMNELEKLLANLGVNKLVLPAVPEAYDTWKGAFGFDNVPREVRKGLLPLDIMLFPGAEILEKPLHPKRRSKASMRLTPFSAEAGHQQGAMAQAADAALETGAGVGAGADSQQPAARVPSPDLGEGQLALVEQGAAGDSVDVMATPPASCIGAGAPGAQVAPLLGSVEGGVGWKGAGRNRLLGAQLVDAWHTGGPEDVGEGAEDWEPFSPWAGAEPGHPQWLGNGEGARKAGSPAPRPKDPWAVPVLSKKGKGAKDALRAYQRRAREAGGEMPLGLLVGYTGVPWKELTPWWERKGEAGVCQGRAAGRYLAQPPSGPVGDSGVGEDSLTWLEDLADLVASDQPRGAREGGVLGAVVALEATESKDLQATAGEPQDLLPAAARGGQDAEGDGMRRGGHGAAEQAATGDGRECSVVVGVGAPDGKGEEEDILGSRAAPDAAAAPEEADGGMERDLGECGRLEKVAGSPENVGLDSGVQGEESQQQLGMPSAGVPATSRAEWQGAREREGPGAMGVPETGDTQTMPRGVEATREEPLIRHMEEAHIGGPAAMQDRKEEEREAPAELGRGGGVAPEAQEGLRPSYDGGAGAEPDPAQSMEGGKLALEGNSCRAEEESRRDDMEAEGGQVAVVVGQADLIVPVAQEPTREGDAEPGGSCGQEQAQGLDAFSRSGVKAGEASADGAPQADPPASAPTQPPLAEALADVQGAARAPGADGEEQEGGTQKALPDEVPETPEAEVQQEEQEKEGQECPETRQGQAEEVQEVEEVKEENGKEEDRPQEKGEKGGGMKEEREGMRSTREGVGRRGVMEKGKRENNAQPVGKETRSSARLKGATKRPEEAVDKDARSGGKKKGKGEKREVKTEEEELVDAAEQGGSFGGSWDAVTGSSRVVVLCLPAPNSAEASAMGKRGRGKAKGAQATPLARTHSSGASGQADTPGPSEATDAGAAEAAEAGAPSPEGGVTGEDRAGAGEGDGEERKEEALPRGEGKGAGDEADRGGGRDRERGQGMGKGRGHGGGLKRGDREGKRRSTRLVEVGLAGPVRESRQGMSASLSKFRQSPRLLRSPGTALRPGSASGAPREGRRSVRLSSIVSPAKNKGSTAKPTPGAPGSVKEEPRGGPVKKSLFAGGTAAAREGEGEGKPGAAGTQVKPEVEGASGEQAGEARGWTCDGGTAGEGSGKDLQPLGLPRKRKRGRGKWYHGKSSWKSKKDKSSIAGTAAGDDVSKSKKFAGHRSKVKRQRLEAIGVQVGAPVAAEAGPGAEEEGKGRRTLRLTLRGESIAEGLVGARAVAPLRPGEEGAYETTPGSRGKANALSPVDFASLEVACWDGCEEDSGAPVSPLQGVLRLARLFGYEALAHAVPVEVVSRTRPSCSQTSGGSSWLHLPAEPTSRGVSRTGEMGHKAEGRGEGEGGRASGEEGKLAGQGKGGGAEAGGGRLGKRKRDRGGLGISMESDEEEVDSVSCARTQGTPPAVLREKKSPKAGPRTTRGALLRAGLFSPTVAAGGRAPANGESTNGTPLGISEAGAGGALAKTAPAQGMPRGRTKKELAAAMRGVALNGLSPGSPSPSAAQGPGQGTPSVHPATAAPAAHQPEGSSRERAVEGALHSGEVRTEQGQAGKAGELGGKEGEDGGPLVVHGTANATASAAPGTGGASEQVQAKPREEVRDCGFLILPGCAVGPTLAWQQTSVSVPVVYQGARAKGGALADQRLVTGRSLKGAGRGRLGNGGGNVLRLPWNAQGPSQEDGGQGDATRASTPLTVSTTGAVVGEGSWNVDQGSPAVRALESFLSTASAEKEREKKAKVTFGGKGPQSGHARPAGAPEEGVKGEPAAGLEGVGEGIQGGWDTTGVPGVAVWEVGASPLGRGSPLTLQQLAARRKRSHTAMKRHMWVGSVIGEEEGEGEQQEDGTGEAVAEGATSTGTGSAWEDGGGTEGEGGGSEAGAGRKRRRVEGQGRGGGGPKRELVVAQQSKDREARHALRLQRMDASRVSTDDTLGSDVEEIKGTSGTEGGGGKGCDGADSVKAEPGLPENGHITASKGVANEGDKHKDIWALVPVKAQPDSSPTGTATVTSLGGGGDGALLFGTPQKALAVYERQRKSGASPRPRLKAFLVPKMKGPLSVLGTPRDSRHSKTAACTFEDSDSSLLKLDYDELLF